MMEIQKGKNKIRGENQKIIADKYGRINISTESQEIKLAKLLRETIDNDGGCGGGCTGNHGGCGNSCN